MNDQLFNRLQIWGFEEDFIVFKDGSLGFALQLSPIDISCFEDEDINALHARVAGFLNALPDDLSLQFVQDIEGTNSDVLEKHMALSALSASPTAQALCRERIERLEGLNASGLLPFHSLRLFVRVRPKEAMISKFNLFSRRKSIERRSVEGLDRQVKEAKRLADDVKKGLEQLEVASSHIKQDELWRLLFEQWNPDYKTFAESYDPSDIRSSLLFTDAVISERGFGLGKYYHRVISLKNLPDHTFSSMAAELQALPFDSRLMLSVYIPNQVTEQERLQTQRRIAYSMSAGKTSGVSDIESKAKLSDLEGLLESLIAQGEKVFHVGLNVILRSESEEDLEDQVSETLQKIRALAGAEAMVETIASFDIFSQLSLPNATPKERVKKLKTSNLADFLPIYGPWQGSTNPSILLRNRTGNLVNFDPFDATHANSNQIVSGGSGSGKSFLTTILMLQMLKENPRVFIIDIGGSYKKLCEILDGQYIDLGVTPGLSINPFDISSSAGPDNAKIKFLLGITELMIKEEDMQHLARFERAAIEEAITKVYETCKGAPCLSDLKTLLLTSDDDALRKLGIILNPWCGNSVYGQFIDRPTAINFEKSIVCFDLKGLESYPDLQAVCLYIITDFIWREIQADRASKKYLIFDECWKILENPAGSVFLAEVFRTFRKYYASAIAISQNIDDFAKSTVANAILPNSAIKWILRQKGADPKRLKEVLSLNTNEMKLVESLHQERGSYSEALLIAQDKKSLVTIESTPLEYWTATTDPRETSKITEMRRHNPNGTHLDILTQLASQYPHGLLYARDHA